MKIIKSVVLLFLATLILGSCSKDDGDGSGITSDVYVSLINKGTSKISEGEATEIKYEVVLSKSFDKDVTLVFELENLTPNLVSIPASVTITKNQTKGTFVITGVAKSYAENVLTENTNFNVLLKSTTGIDSKVVLDNTYKITVTKEEALEPLTAAQKTLIEGYKAKGIDLTKWIGKIPVSVKVTTGANGYYAFLNSEVKDYSGVTYITLSDNATADKPLLKMVNNAFGLNEYLQWVFRGETIENEDWYISDVNDPRYPNLPPAVKKVMTALGEEKVTKWQNKEYSFNVVIDDIEVNADGTIIFVSENNAYENEANFVTMLDYTGSAPLLKDFSGVDFEYEFPLWDEFKKLAEGNSDLTEQATYNGSIHPNYYINETEILEDVWKETNWVEPIGTYSATEMKFKFNSDHLSSGDYDIIEVIFTAK